MTLIQLEQEINRFFKDNPVSDFQAFTKVSSDGYRIILRFREKEETLTRRSLQATITLKLDQAYYYLHTQGEEEQYKSFLEMIVKLNIINLDEIISKVLSPETVQGMTAIGWKTSSMLYSGTSEVKIVASSREGLSLFTLFVEAKRLLFHSISYDNILSRILATSDKILDVFISIIKELDLKGWTVAADLVDMDFWLDLEEGKTLSEIFDLSKK